MIYRPPYLLTRHRSNRGWWFTSLSVVPVPIIQFILLAGWAGPSHHGNGHQQHQQGGKGHDEQTGHSLLKTKKNREEKKNFLSCFSSNAEDTKNKINAVMKHRHHVCFMCSSTRAHSCQQSSRVKDVHTHLYFPVVEGNKVHSLHRVFTHASTFLEYFHFLLLCTNTPTHLSNSYSYFLDYIQNTLSVIEYDRLL